MNKFIKMEEDDDLAMKIREVAKELNLTHYVDIQPRYLSKAPKNNVGSIHKWNDVSATLTDQDNTVIVAVYGQAFERVDEETQMFWLRSLMSQIYYDFDKDKIVIDKNVLMIPLSVFQKYKTMAVEKKELEIHILNQLDEEEKERKEAEKEAKKAAKEAAEKEAKEKAAKEAIQKEDMEGLAKLIKFSIKIGDTEYKSAEEFTAAGLTADNFNKEAIDAIVKNIVENQK